MNKKIKLVTTAVSIGLVMAITACDDKSPTADTEKNVTSKEDLGSCGKKNNGDVVFVEDEDAEYVCSDEKWVKIVDEESSSSDKEESSSSVKSSSSAKSSSSEDSDSDESSSSEDSDSAESSSSEETNTIESSSSEETNPVESSSSEETNPVESSSSVESFPVANCGNLWCGPSKDHVVKTGFENAGKFVVETDFVEGGKSSVQWPVEFAEGETEDLTKVIDEKGALEGTINFGTGSLTYDSYTTINFTVSADRENGNDITKWRGVCVAYTSSISAQINIIPTAELQKYIEFDNYSATLLKSTSVRVVDIPWSAFKQGMWGEKFQTMDKIVRNSTAIQFQFQGHEESADFSILSIGKYGSCANAKKVSGSTSTCGLYDYNPEKSVCDHRDSTMYKTVKLGQKTWLAENLSYNALGSVCGHDENGCKKYGRLYDWATAMNVNSMYNKEIYTDTLNHRGICPEGWHVPTMEEAESMTKDMHVSDLTDPEDFAALYAGQQLNDTYMDTDSRASFWLSGKGITEENAPGMLITSDGAYYGKGNLKTMKRSLRCIKD